jgi:OmpA-OmpF porin, OOP family
MRKIVLGAVMASTALATPALAREGAWYIELNGGATIVENADVYYEPIGVVDATLDTDVGFDVGGIVGYDFGMFRLETEVSYKRAGNNEVTYAGTPTVTVTDLEGHVDSLSFMVNGLVDF